MATHPFQYPDLTLFLSPQKHRCGRKALAGFPASLCFLVVSLWSRSEGVRAADVTKKGLMSVGLGTSGRPIRLRWGPAKFSYGFHITRPVLISLSFLASLPPHLRKKGSAGDLQWGLHTGRSQGSEEGKRPPACAEPREQTPQGPSPPAPSQGPPSSLSWPPWDSVLCLLFPPRGRQGKLAGEQKPLAASGLAEV